MAIRSPKLPLYHRRHQEWKLYERNQSTQVANPNAYRKAVAKHFQNDGPDFDLKVQFWNNSDTQPIEDASIEWKEDEAPFRTVATVKFDKHNAASEERLKYFDGKLDVQTGA